MFQSSDRRTLFSFSGAIYHFFHPVSKAETQRSLDEINMALRNADTALKQSEENRKVAEELHKKTEQVLKELDDQSNLLNQDNILGKMTF